MKVYRVDRWLTLLGIASRKEGALLIKNGMVQTDSGAVTKADLKLNEGEKLTVEGHTYVLREFVYYMMNKPEGILSASRDNREQTVIDLIPQELWRPNLFPAGRLDKDTEGFVLITNDGQFAHRVLSPKNYVPKTYIARLNKKTDFDYVASKFAQGVDIGEEKITLPAKFLVIEDTPEPLIQLVITEGKFHQVKRMFLAFDLEVIYLKRTKIGELTLDSEIKLGECRACTHDELQQIIIDR